MTEGNRCACCVLVLSVYGCSIASSWAATAGAARTKRCTGGAGPPERPGLVVVEPGAALLLFGTPVLFSQKKASCMPSSITGKHRDTSCSRLRGDRQMATDKRQQTSGKCQWCASAGRTRQKPAQRARCSCPGALPRERTFCARAGPCRYRAVPPRPSHAPACANHQHACVACDAQGLSRGAASCGERGAGAVVQPPRRCARRRHACRCAVVVTVPRCGRNFGLSCGRRLLGRWSPGERQPPRWRCLQSAEQFLALAVQLGDSGVRGAGVISTRWPS